MSKPNKINIIPGQIPIVFLHAFPLDSTMWYPQLASLEEKEISYIALDFPGFGESEPFNQSPTMDDFAGWVQYHLSDLGIGEAIFVGLSMGGYVALAIYRRLPGLFRGLVLANTRAKSDSEEARKQRHIMIKKIEETGVSSDLIEQHRLKFFSDQIRRDQPALVDQAVDIMRHAKNIGIIHALQAMAGRADSETLLSTIPFPVLVIAGEFDELTTVSEAQRMASLLRYPLLRIINGAAHLSNMEHPQIFLQELLRYHLERSGIVD